MHKVAHGFTVAEMAIVIVVIAILAAIVIASTSGDGPRARDAQRTASTTTIAAQLERYYRTQVAATGATYPPTSVGTSGLAAIVNSSDATTAPGQSSNSLVIASSVATQSPTINQYIYQPLTATNALCTAVPCVRFILYYRLEVSNTIITINSMRQQ